MKLLDLLKTGSYFVFITILLISSINAASLVIEVPSSINVIKDENYNLLINVTNPNNYDLIDIEIEGNLINSNKINLSSNETKTLQGVVLSNTVGQQIRNYEVIGFKEVNCSVLGSVETFINITSFGAEPRDIDICKSSSVRFTNSRSNSVRLLINDYNINQTLVSQASHVQNYPTLGNYVYKIDPLIDIGVVRVGDTTQKVHSDSDDVDFTLTITTSLESTVFNTTFSKKDFNMSHNEIVNSFLIIKNTGSVVLENVRLFGEWFNFDKNNFNVNPNSEVAINFVISVNPAITKVDDTGKFYSKDIRILSDNAAEQLHNISIYIQKENVISGNISTPEWWQARKSFCDAFPTSPDCITEPIILERDVPVYDCPAILANVSPNDVQTALQQCNILKDNFDDLGNNLKLSVSGLEGLLNNNFGEKILNVSSGFIRLNTSFDNFKTIVYVVIGIIILTIISIISIYMIKRYKKRDTKIL